MNKQQQRIFESDISHNVAVSAGAGTGKSYTLRNKVIDLIKRRILSPKEFLIVTFTNEAANSLKIRIKNSIREDESLVDLVPQVDSMHIDTIDAFRLYIVKKYANYIGIRGEINVLNKHIYKLEQFRVLDSLFEKLYEEKNETLKKYLYEFVTKNDNDIKNLVISVSSIIDTENVSKEEFVKRLSNKFYSQEYLDKCISEYAEYQINKVNDLVNELYALSENLDQIEKKNGDLIDNPDTPTIQNKIAKLFDLKSMDDLYNGITYLNSDKTKLSNNSYTQKDRVKELLKKLKAIKCFDSKQMKESTLKFNGELMPFFFGIAYDLKERMNQFLTLNGMYDFQDIAKLALKVLDYEQPLKEIKESFKFVAIDEYQDNSDIDDELFTKIANNNIFVVGDVKQSIYGFKGANPQKFNKKFEEISEELETVYGTNRYTMFYNYRSRKEVLDGVNQIFNKFMDVTYGGVDYSKDDHALKYDGNPLYDNCEDVLSKDKGIKSLYCLDNAELAGMYNLATGENVDEKFAKDNKFLLTSAFSILGRLKEGVKVARPVGKMEFKLVPATFKHFAILTRNNVDSETTREIFSNLGIPVNIVTEENINQDIMVTVLLSLIKAIRLLDDEDNNLNEFKLSFASIARSFIYQLKDQEIYDSIANTVYSKEEKRYQDNLEYRKSSLYKKLVDFKQNHSNSSLFCLVNDLFNEFDFPVKLARVGNSVTSILKFTKLLECIKSMDEIGYSIDDLIFFFDNINDLGLSLEVRLASDSSDAVTIETIHKSKGLEYPIIYIECCKEFKNKVNALKNNGKETSYFGNPEYGYFLPSKLDGNKTIFIEELAKLRNYPNILSEETRLFYVALTRAQEIAICVYDSEPRDELKDKIEVKTYQDMVNISGVVLPKDEYSLENTKLNVQSTSLDKTYVEIKENKNVYSPIEGKSSHPSIELKEGVSNELLSKGTRYHAYMEYVDFISKDTSFIENKKEREDIDRVLQSNLFKDLSNVRIYKEYKYYDSDEDVTGIIDLLLVYKDKALIVDYKLKNADEEKYSAQLESYKKYIEKVFKLPAECMLLPLISSR